MKRTGWIAVAVALLAWGASAQGPTGAPAAQARLDQVSWLAGEWAGEAAGRRFEEHWMTPAGGAMLAVSRTLRDGGMVEFEFLRIVERDGGLVYVAQPGGRPPTEFRLTAITATSATFENPAHDFPKRIHYERRGDGGLQAVVSDGARALTFDFRRATPRG
jgi:hypothetical protein